jgi:hypothetical protein
VGHWEGDMLVLDSVAFIDTTWLGRGGFFHSNQMHVVERFTRRGNAILYGVTVEDPEMLVAPWVLPTRTLRSNANPDAGLCASEVTAKCTRTTLSSRRFGTRTGPRSGAAKPASGGLCDALATLLERLANQRACTHWVSTA